MALLLELHEIKTIRPELNKALKRNNYPYAIYKNHQRNSRTALFLVRKNNKANDLKFEKLKLFGSKGSADGYILKYIAENEVCASLFQTRSKDFECWCDFESAGFRFDL